MLIIGSPLIPEEMPTSGHRPTISMVITPSNHRDRDEGTAYKPYLRPVSTNDGHKSKKTRLTPASNEAV